MRWPAAWRSGARRWRGRATLAAVTSAAACGVLLLAGTPTAQATGTVAPVSAGALRLAGQLYRQGIRADGTALVGVRPDGARLTGPDAACVRCHRRSGLGAQEGKATIPPIAGEFLLRPRNVNGRVIDGQPATASLLTFRPPFDDFTLARAIRDGIGTDGKPLSLLMPRYPLPAEELAGLQAYLLQLGSGPQAGVDDTALHFATIVTPEADPVARDAMLATLQTFFHDRNHIVAGAARPMVRNEKGVMYRVTRHWDLQVWTLTGPPDTWSAQLQARQAAEPVLAVVSGIGGAHWQPVADFCAAAAVPCLFPNVDVPVAAQDGFYTRYFTRGVFLEADLMLAAVRAAAPVAAGPAVGAGPAASLVLVTHDARAGPAVEQVRAAAAGLGWLVQVRQWPPEAPVDDAALARAVTVPAGTALLLWLPAADLARLPPTGPATRLVLASGLLGGLEDMVLPATWQGVTRLTYPFELPTRRGIALKLPEGWFRIRQVALTAPRVQYQTYLACQILSETVGELHINLVPDYLLERLEVMLSHRQLNGIFPRLSLGAEQAFASKGAYLAHFTADHQLVAEDGWQVPEGDDGR